MQELCAMLSPTCRRVTVRLPASVTPASSYSDARHRGFELCHVPSDTWLAAVQLVVSCSVEVMVVRSGRAVAKARSVTDAEEHTNMAGMTCMVAKFTPSVQLRPQDMIVCHNDGNAYGFAYAEISDSDQVSVNALCNYLYSSSHLQALPLDLQATSMQGLTVRSCTCSAGHMVYEPNTYSLHFTLVLGK